MNKPIVFSDMHHLSLYNSLRLLFEERLKGKLFRPIGKEWFTNGIWKMSNIYNDSPITIEQYLGIKNLEPDSEGIYHPYDFEYEYYQNAITLDTFWKLPVDIVIASLPEHIKSFGELCEKHFNKPKLIYQVGNHWSIQEGIAKNIMASAIIPNVPSGTNIITYHQEFDVDIFYPSPARGEKKMYSFINCLATAEHYQDDWISFLEMEQMMPDWEFKSFGGSCRDGAMNGAQALADKIRESAFVWHVKKFGDGFGHIFFNTFACGKPMITRISDYKGKLGEELLEDEVTCFNVDNRTPKEICDILQNLSPIKYEYMCQQSYNRFKEKVDFDKEFLTLDKWIEKLV